MKRAGVFGMAWLSVLCAPLSMAMTAAFCTGLALLHDVARVLQRSEVVRQQGVAAAAALVADTALAASIAGGAATSTHPGSFVSAVERQAGGWVVSVRSADGERWFVGHELAGAAPELLGRPRSIGVLDRGADDEPMPALAADALGMATRAERSAVFVRDTGIALLRLPVGTDRDDFSLGSGCGHVSFAALGELVVVPGHLWIEPAPTPLFLRVERDTVLVVQGNAYIGRPVRVQGGGRLVLVTAIVEGACAFADVDGDGRWSRGDMLRGAASFRGPIEGSGNIWFGGDAATGLLDVDVGLVVAGEVMVDRPVAVGGPAVVAHGITPNRPVGELISAGAWTFRVDRERVPGFVTRGAPRPGPLQCVGSSRPRDPFGAGGNQTLYLAAPSR